MPAENLLQIFFQSVKKFQKRPCFRFKKNGDWVSLSWSEVERRVQEIALGLDSLGIKKGDRIAIFSSTRVEWTLCDLAILSLGAITVPIYHSNTEEQAAYVIKHSGARLVFAEDRRLYQKVRSVKGELTDLEKIVLFSGKGEGDALTLEQLQKQGKEGDQKKWQEGIQEIQKSDMTTIVYTSGTTGNPKGAILTHDNFLAEIDILKKLFDDLNEKKVTILFLPLAHIMGRVMQFFQMKAGFVTAYAQSIDTLINDIAEVRPDFFVSVPRIFEKIHERVLRQVERGSPIKKALFSWAMAIGREISLKKQKRQIVGPLLWMQGEIADNLVFKKLKGRLGGNLRYSVSGGAPLSEEIAEFFHAAGILILEGYGLTETTAAMTCNVVNDFQFGTVGKPGYGVEVKISSDGEILVKGPIVFHGYYKDPQRTRQAFTQDGWFKTGDVGELDEEGRLRITDRKKDIIVTAAGKNIAPQNIENLMKTVPFISQVMVHGDKRKYLTALVTLNREAVEEYAKEKRIQFQDFKSLAHHPKIFGLVRKAIEEKNKGLASFETIKRFAILENDFSQEAGELTPTLKVRRKYVSEKYRDVLDQLY